MFRDTVDGIVKRMYIIKIDSACSKPVEHPLRILKSHGPPHAVEAFNHGKLFSQLTGQRADRFRIGTVLFYLFIVNPLQRPPQLLMGGISSHDRTVTLSAHAHGWDLRGILQMMAAAPV